MKNIILIIFLLVSTAFSQSLVKKTTSVKKIGYGNFIATAYCIKGSRMANGKFPNENYIAADTRIYPLGTKLMVNNRIYIVGDTGAKIKNNRIDIYMNSCSNAIKFGRKTVLVKKL